MEGNEDPVVHKTYAIVADGKAIKCLTCGRTSWHPEDVKNKYCGNCREFHEDGYIWSHSKSS